MPTRQPTKVSRSLSLPRDLGGADWPLAIANGTVTLLLCYVSWGAGWLAVAGFLTLGVCIHLVLRWKSAKDPWWRLILLVYDRYPDMYEPMPTSRFAARFKRPYGFDQDLSC